MWYIYPAGSDLYLWVSKSINLLAIHKSGSVPPLVVSRDMTGYSQQNENKVNRLPRIKTYDATHTVLVMVQFRNTSGLQSGSLSMHFPGKNIKGLPPYPGIFPNSDWNSMSPYLPRTGKDSYHRCPGSLPYHFTGLYIKKTP